MMLVLGEVGGVCLCDWSFRWARQTFRFFFVINVGLAFVNTPLLPALFPYPTLSLNAPPVPHFDAEGWFVGPSVIKATTADLPTQKEIFGPVLSVITYDDVDEALAVAAVRACGLPGWTRWQMCWW